MNTPNRRRPGASPSTYLEAWDDYTAPYSSDVAVHDATRSLLLEHGFDTICDLEYLTRPIGL